MAVARDLPEELRARVERDFQEMRAQPTEECLHKTGWASRLLHDMADMPVNSAGTRAWQPTRRGPARDSRLTPSLVRVLTCLSRGLDENETAIVLGVSRETVKTELKQARQRLAAKNTTHAVAEAIRAGLL